MGDDFNLEDYSTEELEQLLFETIQELQLRNNRKEREMEESIGMMFN